jgi:hypothetical protein
MHCNYIHAEPDASLILYLVPVSNQNVPGEMSISHNLTTS